MTAQKCNSAFPKSPFTQPVVATFMQKCSDGIFTCLVVIGFAPRQYCSWQLTSRELFWTKLGSHWNSLSLYFKRGHKLGDLLFNWETSDDPRRVSPTSGTSSQMERVSQRHSYGIHYWSQYFYLKGVIRA